VSSRNATLTNRHRFLGQMMEAANSSNSGKMIPWPGKLALGTFLVHGQHAEGLE